MMPVQAQVSKKTEFVYLIFMVWTIFSACFMFFDLSVVAMLKISIFTTPLIVLNILAVGMYICMPPSKKAFGIICALLWLVVCVLLYASQFFDAYKGVFGAFVWLLRDWPYEMLIMVGVAISLYLFFIPFKIVSLAVPKAMVTQGRREFVAGLGLPVLAAVSCSVFHAVNNADFLTPVTCVLFICAFVAMTVILYSLLAFAVRKVVLYKNISLAVTLSFVCWMFLPTIVALMKYFYHPLWLHITVLFVAPVVLFYLFYKTPRLVALYLLISLPISGYNYFDKKPFEKSNTRIADNSKMFALPVLPAKNIAENAPNVYIIIYDGTPNLQMLEKLNVKSSDLKSVLHDNKFTIYDNTFSIAQVSLSSMGATYNMSRVIPGMTGTWQANGGLAAGFEVFRKNGYRVESVQQSFMTGTYQYFDVNLPPREFTVVDKGDFLYFLFKAIFSGEFQFEDIISAGGDLAPYKKEVFEADRQRRVVVMHNYYPGHSQLSGECLPNQKEIYESRFAIARDMLREDLERIERYDPTAIVVVMGDHGPYLTGDCTSLAKSDPAKVSELEVMDRFSTLVAIRWPDAERGAKYGKDILINQDILPAIFAYLYDSAEPLQWKVEPKAYLNGRLVIDEGTFCPVEAKKD